MATQRATQGGGGGATTPNRRSVEYQSVVDAVVSDHGGEEEELEEEEDAMETEARTRQRGREELLQQRRRSQLSVEDKLKIRKTSVILTNPRAHALVLTNTEKTRLQRLQDTCLHRLSLHRPSRYQHPSVRHSDSEGQNQSQRHSHSALPGSSSADTQTISRSEAQTQTQTQTTRPPFHKARRWLRIHIKTRAFRCLLYSVILVDVVALAVDEGRTSKTTTWLAALDVLCTLLLFMEIALKSFAFGWLRGKNAYFTRKKRIVRLLNMALLVLGLLSHAFGHKWRVLRGLKTYRCLTLYAGLRRILRSLARAIPFLANVATLALFFLFAFSIFALEAYKGAYDQQCVAVQIRETVASSETVGAVTTQLWTALPRAYCSTNATCAAPMVCSARVRAPSQHINFDSGLSALFLVFLVVAQDGWVTDIMAPVMQATSHWSALFFVAIVASMVFLVVNLFVAVITTSFMNFSVESARAKEDQQSDGAADGDGDADLDYEQNGDDGDDGDDGNESQKTRGSMVKMDPIAEDTRVNLIMGATLALEETIQSNQQQPEDSLLKQSEHDSTASQSQSIGQSPIAHLLARTHKYHSLRNLTVEATRELIQNATPVEEFLARTAVANKPSVVAPIPEDKSMIGDGDDGEELLASAPGDTAALATTRRSQASCPSSSSPSPSHHPPSRRPTKLGDQPKFTGATSLALLSILDPRSPPWLQKLQRLVLSKRFDDWITACIVVNTLFLLVEYRNMSAWITTMLSVTEYLFATVFLGEMLLRIVALRGLRRYLTSTERWFDFVVVLCTSSNLVLNQLPKNANSFSGLNSVSSLRTLRVTRLMMKWEGTRKLIQSVHKSSRGVMDVVAFLILFQVVNSIVAMQLFGGGGYLGDGEPPRWGFDSFPRSFLTLLQVITADQWSSITYDAVNAPEPHVLLVPFLICIFIIGQYVLLNLFIAVILENFSISEEEAYQLQLEQIIAIPKELDIYEKIEEEGVRAFGEMEQLDNVSNVKLRMFLGLDGGGGGGAGGGDGGAETARTGSANNKKKAGSSSRSKGAARSGVDRVLLLWRRLCRRVARSRLFQRTVQLMILVSCLTLVLDDPHPEILTEPPNAALVLALSVCNRVALGVFVVEFVVKVSASGFGIDYVKLVLFHRDDQLGYVKKQAYIEDRWNQLDCVLLLLTVADEIISQFNDSLRAARMFRAGRVLRPLRILNHNHEMKLILSAVAQSLPHVGNVFGLCALVYVIFGVVGRSLFSGLFFSCNDASVATVDDCVGFYTSTTLSTDDGAVAILLPRVWSNARFSFDNIGAAFLTLLEMTSLKWIDKTFVAMDVTSAGRQPQQDHAPQNALFFVLFVYIGSLFVIRLFVGVLVEQFQRNNGTQILTESQKSWVDLEKFVLLLKPLKRIPRPRNVLQNKLYDLCQHRYFARGIAVAILLNVALLLFNPSNQAASETDTAETTTTTTTTHSSSFQVIEMLFLGIFTTEALLKCISLRHHYVLSPAGAFELLILGGSLVAYFLATGIHGLIQTGRVFRMLRVLRFVRLNRGVYAVFQTFRASLKPIGHIFFLLFMIFFIFAVVGRQLFGGVRFGASLNAFSNFRTFGSSFLLLFQIMAGDDWHLTMTDCMLSAPFCVDRIGENGRSESDCGNPVAAVVYFVFYVTLVVFFLLNLFIAVVLENFRSCYLQGDVCPISLHDFEAYREVFMNYDLDNSGSFPLWQLSSFLKELPPGLRVDSKQHRTVFLQLRSQVQALQESCSQQRCKRPFFNELLRILCIHQLGIRCLPYEQQRDRVKQIFIYRAKVADMLVESAVKGYVQRWRRRKEHANMSKLRSRMTPEVAVALGRSTSVTEDMAAWSARQRGARETAERTARAVETAEKMEEEEEEETVDQIAETVDQIEEIVVVAETMAAAAAVAEVAKVAEPLVEETATATKTEADGTVTPSSETEDDESAGEKRRHRHKHKHKHPHKKHKHKHRRTKDHEKENDDGDPALVVAATTEEEEEGLVRKSTRGGDDEPLYAPRRLPKLTNKIVPT